MGRIKRSKRKLTYKNLTDKITYELLKEVSRYNEIVIPNFYWSKGESTNNAEYYECDIFKVTNSGYTIEYEIKISLEDFKHDFKKNKYEKYKHDLISSGKRTNRFFYVIPEDTIPLELIPEYCGVIIFTKSERFITARNAKLLYKDKIDIKEYKKICKKMAFREINLRFKLLKK